MLLRTRFKHLDELQESVDYLNTVEPTNKYELARIRNDIYRLQQSQDDLAVFIVNSVGGFKEWIRRNWAAYPLK